VTHRNARLLVAALLFLIGAGALRASDPPISIQVDAGDAPRKIFHAHLTIPVKPGPITLVYPKWIPGEHGPTGPIADVAGLRFTVSGKPVQWRRDPVDMYAFHVDVPQGGFSLEVVLDYLSPAEVSGFSSGASATAHMAVISWNQLLLYPEGHTAADVTFAPSLRLPSGWKFGTALPIAKNSGAEVEFQPASLERLVDSPVIMELSIAQYRWRRALRRCMRSIWQRIARLLSR